MARRISEVNGNQPPPSTLAAQIVHNQKQPAPEQNGGTLPLKDLLHEILHNPDAAQETDLGVNVQLVHVVCEAGFGPLALNDPFLNVTEYLEEAKDSIAVIEKTVKRQPEVLLTPISQDGPQLALLLFARLAAVCGRPGCKDLPIAGLFDACIRTTTACVHTWSGGETLRQACQDIAEECLLALEVPASNSFQFKVPSARVVAKLFPQSENAIAVQYICQTVIESHSHAFMLALRLSGASCFEASWRDNTQARLRHVLWQLRPKFERTKQWDLVLTETLASSGKATLLDTLVRCMREDKLSSEVQRALASALLRTLRNVDSLALAFLLPELQAFATRTSLGDWHEDLRIAVVTWLVRFVSEQQLHEDVLQLRNALKQDNVMTDGEFQASFRQLSVTDACPMHGGPRRKRRRLDAEAGRAATEDPLKILGGLTACDLDEPDQVSERVADGYAQLTEQEQCRTWQLLGTLAKEKTALALHTMSKLIKLPEFCKSKRPRVWAMSAIKTGIERTSDVTFLSLANSPLGQFYVSSLHSSQRELRIAVGQCLPCFLRPDLPGDLTQHNRHTALEYLRQLSDRDVASEHETLIGAWGHVGLACGDRELNLVLLRLTDYLGHANSLVSAVAYDELDRLASCRHEGVEAMLTPFWSTVAVAVVQDLQSKPQKAQLLCDLLETDIRAFLIKTQLYTVPTLVLIKRTDVLQRIATSRRNGTPTYDLIMQPKTNMAATAALLLLQPVSDPEEAGNECLLHASSTFRGEDMSHIVKTDAPLIACDILKRTADASASRKPRYYRAFQIFASIAQRRPGGSRAHSKVNKILSEFFEDHLLGIMHHFSETLDNVTVAVSMAEKLRCIKALKEMVQLAKAHVSVALPQLRACLQSAMDRPELCEVAFTVWLDLLSVLNADDIAQMLGQTFALTLQHWSTFTANTHQITHGKIGELIKVHQKVVQDNVMLLPSLSEITLLSKFATEIEHLQLNEDVETRCRAFEKRLRDESLTVIRQSLRELVPFVTEHQDFIHTSAASEQPVLVLSQLLRALLDVTTAHASADAEVAELCGSALGAIGCLDPNRVEAPRNRRQVLVLTNFEKAEEAVEWVIALLEDLLVKAFRSVTNPRSQGFLAYVMQELLRFSGFNHETTSRTRSSQVSSRYQKWMEFPEHVRITLTPFVTSKYHIFNPADKPSERAYPSFSVDTDHNNWVRSLVHDLLSRAKGENPQMIFPLVARLVRTNDIAIATYLLPYAVLNVVVGGTVPEVEGVGLELLAVLQCQATTNAQLETAKQCGETVFSVLDYMSSWLQEKKKVLSQTRADAYRTGHTPNEFNEETEMGQIEGVEKFLAAMPAEAIATRAVECGSYARALFNWEQHIRQQREIIPTQQMSQDEKDLYGRLHGIYSSIEEPDGLEGLGANMSFLTEEQQAIQHTKAGRWTAASAWYETRLTTDPSDTNARLSLLDCLRETGQHAPLLRYADAFLKQGENERARLIQRFAVEAQWMTGDLTGLGAMLDKQGAVSLPDIDTAIGQMLVACANDRHEPLIEQLSVTRIGITQSMSEANTSSIQACHEPLRKLHALYELGAMSSSDEATFSHFMEGADKRLSVLGSYNNDKQYLLGLRRAIMRAQQQDFSSEDAGALWLTTAKLARKAGSIHSAYNAVLQAYACGVPGAKLEEARLFWHDGHQRQAIQALQSAIASDAFNAPDVPMANSDNPEQTTLQHMLKAKAHLLLAKWLDASGQSQAKDMTNRYQFAAKEYQRWEKGHYYLGKHYNKLLEAEKVLPKAKQSAAYLSGEMTKLVVENLMRSIPFGNKYWHETIPKVLTLWLDLGAETLSKAPREDPAIFERRQKALQTVNKQFQKYYERIPAYVFYTALPQLISRISHPHPDVWKQISSCLTKIVSLHPSQAMWYMLPVLKATDRVRAERGAEILNKLKDPKRQQKSDGVELKVFIAQSQKLSDALLQACERPVEARRANITLRKDLDFPADRLAPIPLVVPVESTLMANIPTDANSHMIRKHKAFSQEKITIQGFMDEVLVLSSLQRPRKINVRGSDGKLYSILCKPKDDLRKDQRLMDFNGIINRALKRDAESSKRRLYIKTYAVTPLSEESGTLEWVEGIKPMRDILISAYGRKGRRIDYNRIKEVLDAPKTPAEYSQAFTDDVLPMFPPMLHEWFTETYSDPETWFAARLRYARTCAVMSIVGHILGLGDRHGENILLQEGTGGVFHVDFNCMFDKGRTFEKPELVPFRLTHNMVDAMGAYGYEGPFRKSSELTLAQLRQNRDTLMTVLETFLYDPTTDFVGSKKKRNTAGVPETPQEILDSVDGKLKGLLRGENVPLGVEGYVDALIQEATSRANLAAMYIGWCAFL